MALWDIPRAKDSKDTTPQRFVASTATRLANMGMHLPDDVVEAGKIWYPRVHDLVRRSVGTETAEGRKIENMETAAGITAAVSPNLPFEEKNITAVDDLSKLGKPEWDLIHASNSRRTPEGKQEKRLPEVTDMLRELAPSLVGAYDSGLVKAHRLLQGEQIKDVLPLQGAAKTHHFALNILHPYEDTGVTVDYRHHDLVANSMQAPKASRGIGSGVSSRGNTRYQDIEHITRLAGNRAERQDSRFSDILPHGMQAVLWMGGKHIEQQGGLRKVGPARVGQPYTTSTGAPLARDSHFWVGANSHR